MRALLAIIILAALGWSGFWLFQSTMRDRALSQWLAARQAEGWIAEAADISVAGFPNRVDTTITDLRLADPDAGWRWDADALQILSLTYAPHRMIAVLPGEQTFTTALQTIMSRSDKLRGSVAFRPTPRLELDHATFEIGNMEVSSSLGWRAHVGSAILASRQGTEPFAHDIAFTAQDLALPLDLPAADDVLPPSIQSFALDTTVGFDRPWDRASVEGENPRITDIAVRALTVEWGELRLSGSGAVKTGPDGYAEGSIDLKVRNWRRMLDVARASGAIDATALGAAQAGLGLMARMGGDPEMLSATLTFADGVMRLGPIPLGPAPRLSREG